MLAYVAMSLWEYLMQTVIKLLYEISFSTKEEALDWLEMMLQVELVYQGLDQDLVHLFMDLVEPPHESAGDKWVASLELYAVNFFSLNERDFDFIVNFELLYQKVDCFSCIEYLLSSLFV